MTQLWLENLLNNKLLNQGVLDFFLQIFRNTFKNHVAGNFKRCLVAAFWESLRHCYRAARWCLNGTHVDKVCSWVVMARTAMSYCTYIFQGPMKFKCIVFYDLFYFSLVRFGLFFKHRLDWETGSISFQQYKNISNDNNLDFNAKSFYERNKTS